MCCCMHHVLSALKHTLRLVARRRVRNVAGLTSIDVMCVRSITPLLGCAYTYPVVQKTLLCKLRPGKPDRITVCSVFGCVRCSSHQCVQTLPCAPPECDPTTMHFQTLTLTQCTSNYCSLPGDRSVTVWHFHRTSNTFQPWAAVPACARARMLSCKPLHLDPRTRMLADRVTMRLELCSGCPALWSNALCMRAVRQRVGPTQWGWRR